MTKHTRSKLPKGTTHYRNDSTGEVKRVMSECCSCGFKWPAGQHGGHSCTSYLSADNKALTAKVAELKAGLQGMIDQFSYMGATQSDEDSILKARKALKGDL